jgi:hypothetical protein
MYLYTIILLMRTFLILFTCITFQYTVAQNIRGENFFYTITPETLQTTDKPVANSTINYISAENKARILTEIVKYDLPVKIITLHNVQPFISFSCRWTEEEKDDNNTRLFISFSKDGQLWNAPEAITPDPHAEDESKNVYSNLIFTDKDMRYFRLSVETNRSGRNKLMQTLFLNFYNPGGEQPMPASLAATINNNTSTLRPDEVNNPQTCPCAMPLYSTRVEWNCPQGQGLASGVTVASSVTHLIVHHSAGGNTSGNWAAVVQSIWNQHVNSNGWSDIGYNWLIDPNGVLYEGRGGGNNVIGAHFCGTNGATMGVCMMGTYTSVDITAAARAKLVEILGWKACNSNINPTGQSVHSGSGLNLFNISGHRDGCATECPGNTFYNTLPALRTAVASHLAACTPCPSPDNATITTVPANGVICAPDSVKMTAAANNCTGCTYTWSNGATGPVAYAKTSGTYWVKIVGNCGQLTQIKSVTVTPFVVPSLSISYNGCPSSALNFFITSTQNTGSSPTYNWYVNNNQIQTGPALSLGSAVNGMQVYCRMTSNANCALPTSVNSDTITVNCIATPVRNIDGLEYWTISPNPATDHFYLNMKLNRPKRVQIQVTDMAGKLVYRSGVERLSGQINKRIDFTPTAAGMYRVQLVLDNQSVNRKLIVAPRQ